MGAVLCLDQAERAGVNLFAVLSWGGWKLQYTVWVCCVVYTVGRIGVLIFMWPVRQAEQRHK